MDKQKQKAIDLKGSPEMGNEAGTSKLPLDGTLSEGSVINGSYEVIALLGSGGMSHVYRCRDLKLNRFVAVKLLHAGSSLNPQSLARFQREGQAIALLQHPAIVQVFGLEITTDNDPLLVLEIVPGSSLSELMERQGQLAVYKTLNIIGQVCDGLFHAHSQGVVHRDLKPSNVMIVNPGTPGERAKILDFGIAKIVTDTHIKATQTGEVFGSPAYMSPEQSMGKSVDARSDQYSLGCMIFELLAGRPPFVGDSSIAVIMSHVGETPPKLSKVAKQAIPQHLDQAIAKMLSKNPDDRFANINDAKEALLGHGKIESFRFGWRGSNRYALYGLAALAIIGSCLVLLGFLGDEKSFRHKDDGTQTASSVSPIKANDGALKDMEPLFDSGVTPLFKQLRAGELREIVIPESTTDAQLVHFKTYSDNSAKITKISFKGCVNITDTGLQCLTYMPNLHELNLDGANVTGRCIKWINSLKQLKVLNFYNDYEIDDRAIASLTIDLDALYLKGTNFDGSAFRKPGLLSNLRTLNVDSTNIRTNLGALKNLRLEALYIDDDKLTDSDLDIIRQFPQVYWIFMERNRFSGEGLMKLLAMPKLGSLSVRNSGIDDASAMKFLRLKQKTNPHFRLVWR
jgi:serine/threonine protein kinase